MSRVRAALLATAVLGACACVPARAAREFDEVLECLRRREASGETTFQLYRERAAIHALRSEHDAALAAMQEAFGHGWRLYGSWSLADPMFAGVGDDPGVERLHERMRADVRAMRRRLGMDPGGSPR